MLVLPFMAMENVENKTFLKERLNVSITCNLTADFCKNGAGGSLRNKFLGLLVYESILGDYTFPEILVSKNSMLWKYDLFYMDLKILENQGLLIFLFLRSNNLKGK